MNFANLFLMAADLPLKLEKRPRLIFQDGESIIHVIFGNDRLILPHDKTGSTISLIPLSPIVNGVTLEGDFKYHLRRGALRFGLTLGISNEYYGGQGAVSIEDGTLAVFIQPPLKKQ
jgi:thiamine pyrophosphokinase